MLARFTTFKLVLKRWCRWMFTTTRGLLILTLLCSVACGYRVYKIKRYHAATEALREKGVHLGDPYPDYFGPDVILDYIFYDLLNKKCGVYVELPEFLALDTYTLVIMKTPGVPDDVAPHLKQLHGVNRLSIRSDSPVSEPAENLRRIHVTDYVMLRGPWVDEDVIRAATQIPGLSRDSAIEFDVPQGGLSRELRGYLETCPILTGYQKRGG